IMKFFRIETSSFYKMENYMTGDPRFAKINTTRKYEIVKAWCKKEFGNLEIAARAKVNAPIPFMFNGSILAMSLIGEDSTPAPRLKDVELEYPEKTLNEILDCMKRLYKNNLVHADISEYNILMHDNTPYLIDFGQAVVLLHPSAMDFLSRDVANILDYFEKTYGIEKGFAETMRLITSAK
ncbi:MAG: RIO1 family regulatory kinase/ATPase, partial [Candidatus Micrarchaeales archaeon]